MGYPLEELRGMNEELAAKLREVGIDDSDQLLAAAATPKGRKELAQQVGVPTRDILELANRADLSRIKGVAGVFADLLEKAGVDTVKELATRRPDNLHARILEINADQSIAGRNPRLGDVEAWVAQAKELPKILEY